MGWCVNILFRCDGSIEIGMGHVVRCLALADHMKEKHGCNVYFAMRQSELGINKVKELYPVFESNNNEFDYEDWISGCIQKISGKIFIMDMRDGLTRTQLNKIKNKTGVKVITIDDPENKRLEADLAYYPPVPQLEKTDWNGFNGDLRIGWEYVILRKEFLKKYPKPNNDIPNILVSMGGTDEKNMTKFVIESLNQINQKFKAIIIVGSGYPYFDKLKNSLEKVHFEYDLIQNPKNIAKIMSQSDFAIISFGQTAYELAALNIPTIYLCLTEDHEESAQLFVKEEMGKLLGIFNKDNESLMNPFYDCLGQFINENKINKTNNIPCDLDNIALPIMELAN
jgi:UDP-2,4-diacetamido-2,4,6-trideoxy-beta-L-altropyranose hydrolase